MIKIKKASVKTWKIHSGGNEPAGQNKLAIICGTRLSMTGKSINEIGQWNTNSIFSVRFSNLDIAIQ